MQQMLGREMRMVDAQIVAALQNGTAFFASTSLIAVGGALTLLRSTGEILEVVAALPFGVADHARCSGRRSRSGLPIIFVYAFFKFAWSYRLYNYVAILVGATPPASDKDMPEAKAHAARVGALCEVAGRHFNRGQRAFFFALGYLGWFISPWLLMATSVVAACCGAASSLGLAAVLTELARLSSGTQHESGTSQRSASRPAQSRSPDRIRPSSPGRLRRARFDRIDPPFAHCHRRRYAYRPRFPAR